jgi:hypothetical protein
MIAVSWHGFCGCTRIVARGTIEQTLRFFEFRESHIMTFATISSTAPARRSPWSTLLLKGLAAGALIFSLAGCIPIPVLDISPSEPEAGEAVTFDGTGTIVSNVPTDTVAVSYRWTFGDGSTGSGSSTSHTYEAAGTYDVTLRVIDSAGRVGETMETITVTKATVVTTTDTTSESDTATSSTTSDSSSSTASTTTTQ